MNNSSFDERKRSDLEHKLLYLIYLLEKVPTFCYDESEFEYFDIEIRIGTLKDALRNKNYKNRDLCIDVLNCRLKSVMDFYKRKGMKYK